MGRSVKSVVLKILEELKMRINSDRIVYTDDEKRNKIESVLHCALIPEAYPPFIAHVRIRIENNRTLDRFNNSSIPGILLKSISGLSTRTHTKL